MDPRKPELCRGCPLAEEGEGFSLGDGPLDAPLAVIGEALGREEVDNSLPFVGGSGRVLALQFQQAGLPFREWITLKNGSKVGRYQVRLLNTVNCRPPGNRTPEPDEVKACTERYLWPQLAKMEPNAILSLGNTSTRLLTSNKTGIALLRGSILPLDLTVSNGQRLTGKVVPTLHPAFIMKQQELWPVVVCDIQRAYRESQTSDYIPPQESFVLDPTVNDVRHICERILHTREPFAFDLETTFAKRWEVNIVCLGISPTPGEAICIPFLNQGGSAYWKPEEEEEVWALIAQLMESQIPKITQNGLVFDVPILESLGLKVNGEIHDTLIKHHTVYCELPHKLEFLTSVYSRTPYYKSDVKGKGGALLQSNPVLRRYNCRDCSVDYEINLALDKEIEEAGMKQFYEGLVVPLAQEVRRMQQAGIMVDVGRMKELRTTTELRLKELSEALSESLGYAINIGSYKQLGIMLFSDLGLKPKGFTPTGALATDELSILNMLQEVAEEDSHVLRLIIQCRKLDKLRGTYLQLRTWPDGRVRSEWRVYGTVTGRLSSRDPDLQNIPREPYDSINIKDIYVSEPGKALIEIDYSQLEYRLQAYASGAESLILDFEAGKNIHKRNTRLLFGLSTDAEVDKKGQMYDTAKHFVYADSYGAGPDKIADTMLLLSGLVLSRERVVEYMDLLRSEYPEVYRQREEWYGQAKRTRRLENAFGRPRLFFGSESNIRGEAFNYPIQSTAADIINSVFIAISRRLDSSKMGSIVLQVHDSIMVETLEDKVDEVARLVKEEMERPFNLFGRTITFPVEMSVGRRWSELKSYDPGAVS